MGKNVIYLVADAMRPDYIGCYGNKDVLTTEIDKLANDGVRFDFVITAAPWTIPAIASHLTGIYAHRLGIFSYKKRPYVKSMFNYFKEAGYVTGAFFDSEKLFQQWTDGVDHFGKALDIIGILDFITQHKDKKFMIFILYRGTHIPYVLKYSRASWYRGLNEALERFRYGDEGIEENKYRYKLAIETFSEWYLRAIIDRLMDENILHNTAIILTADHGESWLERIPDKRKVDVFSLHGPLLYNDVLRIPLIMWNLCEQSNVIKGLTRSVDILPTLLDYMGIEFDASNLTGVSLKNAIDGKSDDFPEFAISATTAYDDPDKLKTADTELIYKFSIIWRKQWKLIWNRYAENIVEFELYDLTTDPDERLNIYKENIEVANFLFQKLKEEIAIMERQKVSHREIVERLKQLGYL